MIFEFPATFGLFDLNSGTALIREISGFFCQNLCSGTSEGSENAPIVLEIKFYILRAINPDLAHQASEAVSEGG